MGTHSDAMLWYYENVQTALLSDYHSLLLVIFLPLKDINRRFELIRIHVFPGLYIIKRMYTLGPKLAIWP
jgi:hypothetical protein